jgi:hypothetical protein
MAEHGSRSEQKQSRWGKKSPDQCIDFSELVENPRNHEGEKDFLPITIPSILSDQQFN